MKLILFFLLMELEKLLDIIADLLFGKEVEKTEFEKSVEKMLPAEREELFYIRLEK